jgi:hypothetical protein
LTPLKLRSSAGRGISKANGLHTEKTRSRRFAEMALLFLRDDSGPPRFCAKKMLVAFKSNHQHLMDDSLCRQQKHFQSKRLAHGENEITEVHGEGIGFSSR